MTSQAELRTCRWCPAQFVDYQSLMRHVCDEHPDMWTRNLEKLDRKAAHPAKSTAT